MNRLTVLPKLLRRCPMCRFSSTATETAREAELQIPPSVNEARVFAPKIQSLVDQISQLNLLEVSDLNECLKKTLKIEAMPMAVAGAVAAPAASADVDADDAKETAAAAKTTFTVKLVKIDDTKKVAVIKEVKSIVEGLNLVQAKKFVESLPQVLKADVSKDEAGKIKEALEKHGATITLD